MSCACRTSKISSRQSGLVSTLVSAFMSLPLPWLQEIDAPDSFDGDRNQCTARVLQQDLVLAVLHDLVAPVAANIRRDAQVVVPDRPLSARRASILPRKIFVSSICLESRRGAASEVHGLS